VTSHDIEAARLREEIRILVTRLALCGDRGRFADLAACFTEDGMLDWATGSGRGRAAIAANIATGRGHQPIRLVRHHLTGFDIDLASDRASAAGRIGFFALTDAGPDHAGVYLDRYARDAGGWLIAHREVRVAWQAPASPFLRQV